jgi:hypothetical protein
LRADSEIVAQRNTGTTSAHKVIEKISQHTLHIPRLLAEDSHLETKRRYEGEPSRSSFSSASPRSTRLGYPSTSRIESDSTRGNVRIGVCCPGTDKIPRSLNESKKSEGLEVSLFVPSTNFVAMIMNRCVEVEMESEKPVRLQSPRSISADTVDGTSSRGRLN